MYYLSWLTQLYSIICTEKLSYCFAGWHCWNDVKKTKGIEQSTVERHGKEVGWGRCFDWSGKCRRITSRKPQFCAHNWRAINSQFEVVFCFIRRRIYHRKSARLLIVCHILYKTCYHSVSHHVMFKMTVVYAKTRYKGGNFDDLIRSCLLWTGVV